MDGTSPIYDLIWYYKGVFRWEEFADSVAPVLPEYAVLPDNLPEELPDDAQEAHIENEADYTYESVEALIRMGIKDLDGMKGFVWSRPAGWLDVVMSYTDEYGELEYGRYPVDLNVRISIVPEGWKGVNGDTL